MFNLFLTRETALIFLEGKIGLFLVSTTPVHLPFIFLESRSFAKFNFILASTSTAHPIFIFLDLVKSELKFRNLHNEGKSSGKIN